MMSLFQFSSAALCLMTERNRAILSQRSGIIILWTVWRLTLHSRFVRDPYFYRIVMPIPLSPVFFLH